MPASTDLDSKAAMMDAGEVFNIWKSETLQLFLAHQSPSARYDPDPILLAILLPFRSSMDLIGESLRTRILA